jgi:membrane protein DedA with SNARE-associated domain
MEQTIFAILTDYAYSPLLVYGAICLFMFASAFGLPIPEEVVLIAAGFVGYMALNPAIYPPPYEGAQGVNVYVLATVAFVAVTASDFFIYYIGKRMGPPLFKTKWFSRLVNESALTKIQTWMHKYGYWAVFIFRFTPGVRFPGHLMCGAMGLSPWRFAAVDWFAAGFSVPTQVLLVAFYGEYILQYFRQFKIYFIAVLALAIITFVVIKWRQQKRELAIKNASS